MKILITTQREFADHEFDNWIKSMEQSGVAINGKELKEKQIYSFSNDLGYTKATTTYKIVKDWDEQKGLKNG